MHPLAIEPATPCIPAYHSNNSATLIVNDLLLKPLHTFDYQSTRVSYDLVQDACVYTF